MQRRNCEEQTFQGQRKVLFVNTACHQAASANRGWTSHERPTADVYVSQDGTYDIHRPRLPAVSGLTLRAPAPFRSEGLASPQQFGDLMLAGWPPQPEARTEEWETARGDPRHGGTERPWITLRTDVAWCELHYSLCDLCKLHQPSERNPTCREA